MSDSKAIFTAIMVDSVSAVARKISGEISNIGVSVSKTTALMAGFAAKAGADIFTALEHGVSSLAEALPHLIDQGHAYLDQLHQIQLETGMTAEQTSGLVGAFRSMGVPTEDLDTLFSRFGKNLADNESKFRDLGVATRDTTGVMLPMYQVVENLRKRVAELGPGFAGTAAAQDLFGRSGYKIIEALQASDPEWAKAIDNVRRWGGIVSQSAIDGADRLGDSLTSLRQGITDVGVNIAAAIDPYLRAFVESFSSFVQAHLREIVNFAVSVANTITGFISGLFGFSVALDTSSTAALYSAETQQKQAVALKAAEDATAKAKAATDAHAKSLADAASGKDAFGKSIESQIKAIDAHTHALQQAAEARQAIRERDRLNQSLADARAQLADLKGNAPFTEGLSNSEAILARQKHAQDIIDAEKDVASKRTAIGDFEADQKDRAETELLGRQKLRLQDLLAAHKTAYAAMAAAAKAAAKAAVPDYLTTKDKITDVFKGLGDTTTEFGKTAAASFQTGTDAAKAFLDILLGAQHDATGPHDPAGRTGGVVGALGGLGDAIRAVGGFAGSAVSFISNLADELAPLAGLADTLNTALHDLGNTIHDFLVNIHNGLGIPDLPIPNINNIDLPDIGRNVAQVLQNIFHPKGAATGAFVPAQPGGVVMRIGEGAEDEWVIPRSKMPGATGRAQTVNHFHFEMLTMPSGQAMKDLIDMIDEQLGIRADNVPVGLVGFRAGG